MDSDTALIKLKEAQKRYRERNRDKYNKYMRSYYKKRVEDDAYRQKRNEYRKKAYEKQKQNDKRIKHIQNKFALDTTIWLYTFDLS